MRYLFCLKGDRKYIYTLMILLFIMTQTGFAVDDLSYVTNEAEKGFFPLVDSGNAAPLIVSDKDYPGVIRILETLQSDIQSVSQVLPSIHVGGIPKSKTMVLIGTVGKSPIIDELIQNKKLDVAEIHGEWDAFLIQTVKKPLKGVDQALVIAGSNKRGTIYGMLDLSKHIGVSPWVWWADVPPKQSETLYIQPGKILSDEPAVKYRGIFLNDEEPALGRWAVENYGGFNSQFYEKLFVLMLRMRANYIWPAMWWASFSSDDPENPRLADELGIVAGTTHHEPLMRAHAEWKPYGGNAWNYETNAEQLREFWIEGIERMGDYESIVTLAMRGDGDTAMGEDINIALLQKIVKDQREILTKVTGKDATEIPQLWALYKEVQDYYDKGMTVPDDVTLLLCDDNWGNVRRLPKPESPTRAGGYGMYYHFDFVGGPRNHKWLNTSPIAHVWEQMHLCYRHGVDRIWLVNVGDLKPMEFPIEFFLDYAWNPDQWPADRLPEYTKRWAGEQFGCEYAEEIADILNQYTKFNSRRKPEMLAADTYNLIHYREWETVVNDYNALLDKAELISQNMPPEYVDAYFQLVLHPVKACANLNEMRFTEAKNQLYAKQGRASTNDLAKEVETLFERDQTISRTYHEIAGGKWNNMMNQTHISYTYWQQPEKDVVPKVETITVPKTAEMGVAIEGSASWWPEEKAEALLPEFDRYNQQSHYIEVFNRGQTAFEFTVEPEQSWVIVIPDKGTVNKEERVWVDVDWSSAPTGESRIPITVTGSDGVKAIVHVVIHNPESPNPEELKGFVESDGVVSMEAEHYSKAVDFNDVKWTVIPNQSRTLSGITPLPVTAVSQKPADESPRLEYEMFLFNASEVEVHVYFSPTQDFLDTDGMRYGISFDDAPPQIMNIHVKDTIPDWKYPESWNEAVSQNIKVITSTHSVEKAGNHVLKFWMVDPGLVLQKLVVDVGGLKPSYLGPPESYRRTETE